MKIEEVNFVTQTSGISPELVKSSHLNYLDKWIIIRFKILGYDEKTLSQCSIKSKIKFQTAGETLSEVL